MSSIRAPLVSNAVSFLRDPKTQQATLEKRIEFLRVKGLTTEEIDAALEQVGITKAITPTEAVSAGAAGEYFSVPAQAVREPSYQYYQPPPPPVHYGVPPPLEEHRRDWKDWFVMAVISGTVMVGAYSVARKFLFPHLVPPPLNAFQQTQAALDAQFDEITNRLNELAEKSEAQQKLVEEQKAQVDRAITDVEAVIKEIKAGEERNRNEMQEIKDEVGNVKELVPKLIQSSQSSATSTLSDVQQELKSLKQLLLARPATTSFPSPGGASSPAPFTPGNLPYGAGSGPSTPLTSGRPFIPAWQLASKPSGQPAPEKEELASSGVLVDSSTSSVEAPIT